jgi:hypothetical protein
MLEGQSRRAAPALSKWSQELKLSTKGLENVASLGVEDFSIRVGGHSVGCSRFEASFLSPRITAALLNDPTITEYELELGDCCECDWNCVSGLLSLSRNGSFDLTSLNFSSVKSVVKALGNRQLGESLIACAHENEEINESSAVTRLALADFLEVSTSAEIDYLASHFYEIDHNLLKSLSHRDLLAVLSSAKLQVETEDSLLNFLLAAR